MKAKLLALRRDWNAHLTWETQVGNVKAAQAWAANEAGKFVRQSLNPDIFGKRNVDTRDANDKRLIFKWRQPEDKAEMVVDCNREIPAPVEFILYVDFTPEEMALVQNRLREWVEAQTNPGILLKEFDLLVRRGFIQTN